MPTAPLVTTGPAQRGVPDEAEGLTDLAVRVLDDHLAGALPPGPTGDVLVLLRRWVAWISTDDPEDRTSAADAAELLVEWCVDAAAHGVELRVLLDALDSVLRSVLRRMWTTATSADQTRVLAASAATAAVLPLLHRSAVHALASSGSAAARHRRQREERARTLLRGEGAGATGPPWSVVVVAADRPCGHRSWRAALDGAGLPDGTLHAVGGIGPERERVDEVALLLPGGAATALDAVVLRIGRGLGRAVRAGVVPAAPAAEVPAAHDRARRIAASAGATRRGRSCFGLDDVLIEMALQAAPEACRHLSALVEPLRTGPDLLVTLETLYEHDLDRTATARLLHVHRATLDYRLRRVRELTGLDPLSSRGVRLLASGLAAVRLRAG